MSDGSDQDWTYVITPKKKVLDLKIREMIKYRDLLYLLIRRDFVAQYKQSVLGPLWFILQPLLNTLVFTVIFGKIAKMPTDGVPNLLFFMAGNIIWAFFAVVFNDVGQIFASNSSLFGKVYFPRLISPAAVIINKFFTFCIQLLMFLGFLAYFLIAGAPIHPNSALFLMPILLIHVGLLGMGTGLTVAALTTKYRDLRFLVSFGLQLWMYATPIVYPSSIIPPEWLWVYWINPMAPVVELFRYMFLGAGQVSASLYVLSLVESCLLIVVGLALFTRAEKDFIDRI